MQNLFVFIYSKELFSYQFVENMWLFMVFIELWKMHKHFLLSFHLRAWGKLSERGPKNTH